MNRVEISGGVVRDPELRQTGSGTYVTDLTVAVNGTRYDFEQRQQVIETSFISTVWWGHLAEKVVQLLEQGDEVWLIGELHQIETEKGGKKERKTKVKGYVFQPIRKRVGPKGGQPTQDEEAPF